METQNLTLSLPRDLLRKVKVVAAKRETSISALVTASLEDLVRQEDGRDEAVERFLERMHRGFPLGANEGPMPSRDSLHEG
ncbi:MAG: DUF6364 family protein [Candidatus Dormibacteria bacterium]